MSLLSPFPLPRTDMTLSRYGTATASRQTCWANTVGTSLLQPSSPQAPLSTLSSPLIMHGKALAFLCAMRSTRQVSVKGRLWIGSPTAPIFPAVDIGIITEQILWATFSVGFLACAQYKGFYFFGKSVSSYFQEGKDFSGAL